MEDIRNKTHWKARDVAENYPDFHADKWLGYSIIKARFKLSRLIPNPFYVSGGDSPNINAFYTDNDTLAAMYVDTIRVHNNPELSQPIKE